MAVSPEQLKQVSDLLLAGFNYRDPNRAAVQEQVNTVLRQFAKDPSFNACLLELTVGHQDPQVQQLSALNLKQNIEKNFDSAIKPNVEGVKQKLLQPLVQGACAPPIRRAVGACISELAKTGNWPTLVQDLWPQFANSRDPQVRLGVLTCIADVCEYCTGQVEAASAGAPPPAKVLIPELVKLMIESQSAAEVLYGAKSCFSLLDHQGEGQEQTTVIYDEFRAVLPQVLQALQKCATLQGAPEGKQITEAALRVYRALLWYYEDLKTHGKIQAILQLVFQMSDVRDEQIALAACEFWQDLAAMPDAVADLASGGVMQELAKLLLKKLVMSDEEVAEVEMEEESANVVPRNRGKKKKGGGGDDDDGEVEQWTVRRCATLTLDAISRKEGSNLVTPPGAPKDWLLDGEIFPRLTNSSWKVQESAILALGAISEGCFADLRPRLDSIFPQLCAVMTNPQAHFLLRSITFTALGRRGILSWICSEQRTFDPFLKALLGSMSARERKVQEAAVSCFLSLLEFQASQDGGFLTSNPAYFSGLLNHISEGLVPNKYTSLNLLILMEAIDAFAALYGPQLGTPEAEAKLIAPLIQNHFLTLPPDDNLLLPRLLMTLCNLAATLEEGFLPYTPAVYQHALRIFGRYFGLHLMLKDGKIQEKDVPDLGENPKYAADLISCLIESVGSNESARGQIAQMVLTQKYEGSDPRLALTFLDLAMLPFTQPQLQIDDPNVLLACVTFFGEQLKNLPQQLLPGLLSAQPAIFAHLKADGELGGTVAWFAAELVMQLEGRKAPQEIQQICGNIAGELVPLLVQKQQNTWHDSLLQNAAVTIGRMGLIQTELLAPQLASFFKPLCNNIAQCDDAEWDDIKMQAFLGVIRLTQANFRVLSDMDSVKAFAGAVSSFTNLADLQELCQEVAATVQELKRNLGADWAKVLQQVSFPPVILARLH